MQEALKSEDTKAKKYKPDAKRLGDLFSEAQTRPESFFTNAEINRSARYNYWAGKSWDGRKWYPAQGDAEVFPWKGASDIDVPLVDGYVNEDVAVSVQALLNGNVTITGHTSKDVQFGARCTNILKWMLEDEMTERFTETMLAANWHFERGKTVVGVQWERQVQMGYQELTMDQINAMAQQAQQQLQQAAQTSTQQPGSPDVLTTEQKVKLQQLADIPQMLSDEANEDKLVELLQEFAATLVTQSFAESLGGYGEELTENYELPEKTARRVVKDLREDGKSKFPVPYVKRNRPVLVALSLGDDFFTLSDGLDMENARAMFWLEWLTEEQIRERQISQDWDPDWCEDVIKHGKGGPVPNTSINGTTYPSYYGRWQAHGKTMIDTMKRYGIVHCYERRSNEDNVPAIYYTVIHPSLTGMKGTGKKKKAISDGMKTNYAVSLQLDYAHGEYPFILFRREFLSRRIDDSRGAGEIAFTWQRQIKTESDMQIDRSTLATNPPLHHPKGKPPTKWGPGAKVPASQGDYHYAEIPEHDPGSAEVLTRTWQMADWYFGRQVEGRDPTLPGIMRQQMVSVWLEGWRQVYMQMFQLMQQYMPDDIYYRVTGNNAGQTLHATRAEIQGKFSLSLDFDTQRLDPKLMEAKTDAMIKIVGALDINGIADHNKMLGVALSWLDPDLPDMILRPADAATQQEVIDEQNVFARMWAGIGTNVQKGQAYQLRLQTLQQALAGKDPKTGEPTNPAALARYQQDESFKGLVDNRVQQLQFQLQQQQNAQIGRLGAEPAAQ